MADVEDTSRTTGLRSLSSDVHSDLLLPLFAQSPDGLAFVDADLIIRAANETCARQAGVPVFIARQKQHDMIDASDAQAVPRLATILCPVNFTSAAQAALDHAASIASQFKARLITACIVEPADQRDPAEARKELDSWVGRTTAAQCDVQTLTRTGDAATQIISLAAKTKADLIVLGAQPRRSLRSWLWGDTTEFVLRNAPAPVLLVPQ